MKNCDIAVVGGGAAGCMAAISAGRFNKRVVLIEKNDTLGKKIMLTGKTRCNLTNDCELDKLVDKFAKQGPFYRSAFFKFSNLDLMDFFKSRGLRLKVERQGRVFPISDDSGSVVKVLKESLLACKVEILYNAHLLNIKKDKEDFLLVLNSGDIKAKKVILATGGASYKETGSTGDGFRLAKRLGHTIVPLMPALVPLKTEEAWTKQLQGLKLKNVRVIFARDKRYAEKIESDIGELIFTHFGVSGPLILDLSGAVMEMLREDKEVKLFIDLKPGLSLDEVDERLLNDFKSKGKKSFKNILEGLLPKRLAPVFIDILGIDPQKKTSQMTKDDRRSIAGFLKALPLTVTGALSLEEAMVTAGGVSVKEINPRTMESRVVPGLYFSGELIDGSAPSGGYNLQQAFSTGFVAGEGAANA